MIIVGILICIVAAGFFAGLETGILSANQLSLFSKVEKKIFYARAANYLLLKPERLLSTTLIGTNIAVVSATVLLKSFLDSLGLPVWCSMLGSLLLTFVLLIFAEIIPKSFFRYYSETISLKLAPVLVAFYFLFLPISVVLNALVSLFLLNRKRTARGLQSREDLKLMIKLISKEAGISPHGQSIFDDIFDFKNTLAREVMIPFHLIPVCSADSSLEQLVSIFGETRSPMVVVYKERTDNVAGLIFVEDLMTREGKCLMDFMAPPWFYPETKRIPGLLTEMNHRKIRAAFLSDEYGGISGVISPDEIASEIMGEIPGRVKEISGEIEKTGLGIFTAPGHTDIEDFTNFTGIILESGPYDTIGGYLCDKLGIIPEAGAVYRAKGVMFTVIERDDRHIIKLEIRRIKRDEIENQP